MSRKFSLQFENYLFFCTHVCGLFCSLVLIFTSGWMRLWCHLFLSLFSTLPFFPPCVYSVVCIYNFYFFPVMFTIDYYTRQKNWMEMEKWRFSNENYGNDLGISTKIQLKLLRLLFFDGSLMGAWGICFFDDILQQKQFKSLSNNFFYF